MDERRHKAAEAVAAAGADWALLTGADTIAYVSGHIAPIEAGPSPFAGGPTTAILGCDGSCVVVAANVEAAAAGDADATELYEGFTYETGPDLTGNYRATLAAVLSRLGVRGTVAVERRSLPLAAAELLDDATLVPFDTALDRARAVKTAPELEAMRRAGAAAAAGQEAFMAHTRAGRTELDIFADIRAAMENMAGERVPVLGDFLSGRARTAAFTGWPVARTVEPGDPLISDLGPRVAGYWGDSCASAVLGEPGADYLRLFDLAKSALTLAGDLLRPGLAVSELDRRLREHVGRGGYAYPHHSGHSLGTAVHEWPRIVPYEHAELEQGMVVMVEPGAYDPDIGGVRIEWMFEIEADGCRVLTEFEHVPSIPS